jgi:peroxiredoxin
MISRMIRVTIPSGGRNVRRALRHLIVALPLAAPGLAAGAEDEPKIPTLALGASAPDFDLPGVDGRRYTLRDFASAKLLVMIFTANHCPTAQAYEERMRKLHEDYAGRGVAVVAVSPNDPLALRLDELGYTDVQDRLEDMVVRAKDRGFRFPYLYDGETQAMSREYGPVATPHVFVFDAERKLRFVGRVDDSENPARVKTHDTRAAIEALLAGRPVPVAQTKVFGCSIKWSEKRGSVQEALEQWAREPVGVENVDAAGLRALAANDSNKLRLINVWATWCGPCVIEFPDLVAIHRTYRGRAFEVVSVSADDPAKRAEVVEFLERQQASTRNYVFETGDPYALIEAVDSAWRGALPHTVVVAPGGKVVYRSEGAFDKLRIRKAIVGWLGRYYHSTPGGS